MDKSVTFTIDVDKIDADLWRALTKEAHRAFAFDHLYNDEPKRGRIIQAGIYGYHRREVAVFATNRVPYFLLQSFQDTEGDELGVIGYLALPILTMDARQSHLEFLFPDNQIPDPPRTIFSVGLVGSISEPTVTWDVPRLRLNYASNHVSADPHLETLLVTLTPDAPLKEHLKRQINLTVVEWADVNDPEWAAWGGKVLIVNQHADSVPVWLEQNEVIHE